MNELTLSQEIDKAVVTSSNNESLEKLKSEHEESVNNIKVAVSKSMDTLNTLVTLCKDGESPKHYESLSKLLNSITSANKEIFQQTKEMYFLMDSDSEESEKEEKSGGIEHADNVLIMNGTFKDIQEMIRNTKEETNE